MCVNLTGTFFLKTLLHKTLALSNFSLAFLRKEESSQRRHWDIPFEAFLRQDGGQFNQVYLSNRQEQKKCQVQFLKTLLQSVLQKI